jgi:hypothetical protein
MGLPMLFSGLFYVAASRLNSPRLSLRAYTPQSTAVSRIDSFARLTSQEDGARFPPSRYFQVWNEVQPWQPLTASGEEAGTGSTFLT